MPQRVAMREDVQGVIAALLVARKEASTYGVPVPLLDNDYRDQEGIRIPYRQLGYSCLLDFLHTMSGTLSIRQTNSGNVVYPIGSEKTAHVRSLVAGQRAANRRPRGGRRPVRSSPWYPKVYPPPRRLDSKILSDIVRLSKNHPNGIHITEVLRYIRDRSNCSFEAEDLKLQLREVNHEIILERDAIYPASNYQDTAKFTGNSHASNNNLAKPTKHCNIRAAGSSGSEDDDFAEYVKSAVSRVGAGATNDNATPSSRNVNDNNNSDRNRLEKKEEDKSEKNVEQAKVQKRKSSQEDCEDFDSCDQDNIGMLISERTKFRLEKLVQNHPEGIWCADLPDLYLKEYKFSLNYEELGFGSVSDFAAYLPDVFHSVQLQDKGDFKLFDGKAERPNLNQSERRTTQSLAALHKIYETYGEQVQPIPTVLTAATAQRLVPEGVMPLGETVPQICVTELDRGANDFIDVIVVEIFTPSFFWIHLLDRTQIFHKFMTSLHEFYSNHATKYVMPIVIMERGMNCACKYENVWHRGIIKTVKYDNTVTVMFYDYGTVQSYQPEEIHFLHRSFSALPAQAIPCGLYNVKPRETEKWLRSVTVEFTYKVLDKPLVATIAVTDADNNSMLIGLTNTEGIEDFHIGDWLIEQGHAQCGKMGNTVDLTDTTYDPVYVDASCCQPLPEGVRKPPGLSLGGLNTIVEETNNAAIDSTNETILVMQQKQARMEALVEELLRWKSTVAAGVLDNEKPQPLENSQPPPIPPLPEKSTYTSDIKSETTVPLVNRDSNFIDAASVTNLEISKPVLAPPIFEKFDTNMNISSHPTTSSFPPVYTGFNPQFQTYPNFSNVATSNFSPQVPSFKFTGPLSSNSQTFQFRASKWEPTPRKKFEESLEDSVKNFFERSEKRSKAKVAVSSTSELPNSNPFKEDLENDYHFKKSRENLPPPLPPRSPATKPWAHLMKFEDQNQCDPSTTKMVYEADPFIYDTPSKVAKDTSCLAPVSTKREEFAGTNQAKLTSALKNVHQTKGEDFVETNRVDSYPPSEIFTKKTHESSEDRNLRLFNESFSSRLSKSSSIDESATASVPTNAKTKTRVPPPLPPRPFIFDFNSLSLEEQTRYTDWLKAVEYSDSFVNEESLARNGWQWKKRDDEGAVGYSKPVVSTVERDVQKESPIDLQNSVKTEKSKQKIATIRKVTADLEDPADSWQFKVLHLPNRTVHIFSMDGEGWLATEEFASKFTPVHACPMIKILKTLGVFIPFQTLSRTENLRLFEKLERTSLDVSRDEHNKIADVLHLTPLKSILKILRKLNLVTDDEVQRTKERIYPEKSDILLHAIMVIRDHEKFKQSLQSSSDPFEPM